ncbi:hypothetical protein ACSDR0_46365 [Streptosporangium sp. G11]|uniref:hypothetical protein n=1 Tax=Streptosporangium sp. G11 TaxID=3436926 RepID=UPI003EBA0624
MADAVNGEFVVVGDSDGFGDLNRALHTIILVRARVDSDTHAYIARRISEGKTPREARRCLKRALSRQLFKLLERDPDPLQATA